MTARAGKAAGGLANAAVTADVARDCVYSTLRQSRGAPVTLRTILRDHGLTPEDFLALARTDEFREAVRSERARVRELGRRAALVYRVEDLLTEVVELAAIRARNPATPLAEVTRLAALLARMAGVEEIPERERDRASVNMAVQINVPQLSNPKLAHLKAK
jgi:hypothetical protein